jgi:hypothetical protein
MACHGIHSCTWTNRFVAFIDVLGFSDLVHQNDHASVARLYQTLTAYVQLVLTRGLYNVVENGDGEQRAIPDLSQANANLLIISDSIVIYSHTVTMKGFIDVLAAMRGAISSGFYVGLPMRGAMTVGPCTVFEEHLHTGVAVNTQSIVGRALVDAYQLERCQEWSGAIVSDDAIAHYEALARENRHVPDLATIEYLREKHVIARYDVPYKHTATAPGRVWSVAWPWANRDRPSEALIRRAFAMHNKNPPADAKVANTLAYLDAMRPMIKYSDY